jgi:hypothetical protein
VPDAAQPATAGWATPIRGHEDFVVGLRFETRSGITNSSCAHGSSPVAGVARYYRAYGKVEAACEHSSLAKPTLTLPS